MLGSTLGTLALGSAPDGAESPPAGPVVQIGQATGFSTTDFGIAGIPVGVSVHQASTIGQVTVFSSPSAPSIQTCSAITIGKVANYGGHFSYVVLYQAENQISSAAGLKGTTFGLPDVVASLSVAASGLNSTGFGEPTSKRVQKSTGFSSTQLGSCTSAMRAKHAGSCSTAFGSPKSVQGHPAASINKVRFGQPKCRVELVSRVSAAGFAGTEFGSPSTYSNHRALHIAPIVQFGRGLLRRGTTC